MLYVEISKTYPQYPAILYYKYAIILMKNNTDHKPDACPCCSGKAFPQCCQPYIERRRNAPTAETLMRSRYTAFVLNNEAYLRFSWHIDTCPKTIHLNNETQWLGLEVKTTEKGQPNDDTGRVEFVARYKNNGKAVRLHENSRFIQHEHRWVYLDGKTND